MRRISAAVGTAIALLLLMAQPASAHQRTIYHGSDWARVGVNHIQVQVHDIECDGNYVRAEYRFMAAPNLERFGFVTDSNGCTAGGGHAAPYNIVSFRVCEANSCTAWHSA